MTKLKSLLRKVHESEQGSVSLETVLIIGAIALPILIFLLKVGWPIVQNYFNTGLSQLTTDANNVETGTSTATGG